MLIFFLIHAEHHNMYTCTNVHVIKQYLTKYDVKDV